LEPDVKVFWFAFQKRTESSFSEEKEAKRLLFLLLHPQDVHAVSVRKRSFMEELCRTEETRNPFITLFQDSSKANGI
jgi:hypothetical protein